MSKRKGVSADEKRIRMLNLFYEKKEFFTLKVSFLFKFSFMFLFLSFWSKTPM